MLDRRSFLAAGLLGVGQLTGRSLPRLRPTPDELVTAAVARVLGEAGERGLATAVLTVQDHLTRRRDWNAWIADWLRYLPDLDVVDLSLVERVVARRKDVARLAPDLRELSDDRLTVLVVEPDGFVAARADLERAEELERIAPLIHPGAEAIQARLRRFELAGAARALVPVASGGGSLHAAFAARLRFARRPSMRPRRALAALAEGLRPELLAAPLRLTSWREPADALRTACCGGPCGMAYVPQRSARFLEFFARETYE